MRWRSSVIQCFYEVVYGMLSRLAQRNGVGFMAKGCYECVQETDCTVTETFHGAEEALHMEGS
jgi:hypothetical protein